MRFSTASHSPLTLAFTVREAQGPRAGDVPAGCRAGWAVEEAGGRDRTGAGAPGQVPVVR